MKTFLVIGGSSGIGKQIVEDLIEQEHNVYATYNSSNINDLQVGAKWSRLNVREEISLEFLPEKIDGLVYCPGAINLLPFHRLKENEIITDFELQVLGAVKCIQSALPYLKKSESSSIVLFSSVAVNKGFNFHSLVGISKGAIEGLIKSLAAEFAPKIRVNAIAPSITNTPLASRLLSSEQKVLANSERHPLKRIGQPKDISSMVKFLLTEEASWISGQILAIDGGLSSIKI